MEQPITEQKQEIAVVVETVVATQVAETPKGP